MLDLTMPEVSGLDVLSLSAASPLNIANRVSPSVFAALRKPFDNVALIAAVRGCIEATCDTATPRAA